AHMLEVVNRNTPCDELRPALLFIAGRAIRDIADVWDTERRGAYPIAGALSVHRDAPVGLLRPHPGNRVHAGVFEMRFSVREGDMDLVDKVLDVLEEVALPNVGRRGAEPVFLEGGIAG